MISAKIILDSINPNGDRLTTMEVVMPRIILAEFNTHRKFSRNSASSRAVSVKKKIEEVRNNPFIPVKWTQNEKGMQGQPVVDEEILEIGKNTWLDARNYAAIFAAYLDIRGFHKQICNRLLEPFLWHTVLVSSTEWNNFFIQRCSPLAEPHMEMVANAMKKALEDSTPVKLLYREWHLPFVYGKPLGEDTTLKTRIKVSAARCARVSYQKHGSDSSWEDDLKIGNYLMTADPPHWSPFEHTARAEAQYWPNGEENKILGNFDGWEQARHTALI